MATRFDVSAVPPQDSYVAKQCPVRAQWDTIAPCEPRPPAPAAASRQDAGVAFERDVVAALLALHPRAAVMPERAAGAQAREKATLAAMAARDTGAWDWLLTYTRNHTQATLALREWLDGPASDCPGIADAGQNATAGRI